MPDTYTTTNGSRAVVTNSYDAAMLRSIGWTCEPAPIGTNADTMAREFDSAPLHVGGGMH